MLKTIIFIYKYISIYKVFIPCIVWWININHINLTLMRFLQKS